MFDKCLSIAIDRIHYRLEQLAGKRSKRAARARRALQARLRKLERKMP